MYGPVFFGHSICYAHKTITHHFLECQTAANEKETKREYGGSLKAIAKR